MGDFTAYYRPFTMPGWLGGPPSSWSEERNPQNTGHPIPDSWKEAVVDVQLGTGPRVVAERWGLVKFDFAAGPPWITHPANKETPGFDEAVAATTSRLRILNVHLLLLHVANLDLKNLSTVTARLTPNDLFYIAEDGENMGGPGLARLPLTLGPADFVRSDKVDVEAIKRSLDLLDKALKTDERVFEQLDLLHLGLATYQQHSYSQALVAGWTICEQLITDKWAAYVGARRGSIEYEGERVERVNSKRRDKLQGSDYPMSTVLQILELADALDHSLFRLLNSVRQQRNRWLHRLSKPDSDTTAKALTAASELLADSSGLPLRLSMSLGITSPR